MRHHPAPTAVVLSLALLTLTCGAASHALAQPATDAVGLMELSRRFHDEMLAGRTPLYEALLRSTDPAQAALNANPDIKLQYVSAAGRPIYTEIHNLNAARTLGTDDVWPGGSAGLNLTGSGTTMGKLGVWDAGKVRLTHRELTGRVTQVDGAPTLHYHSTHVAGTLIASGVDPAAKGMSYQGSLAAYEWSDDSSEMAAAAAAGMNVSSHSYGYSAGWYYSSAESAWYWYGDVTISTTEDFGFGYYDENARAWDEVAYAAPYYTILKSAGNERDDSGPGPGGSHYVYEPASGWVWSTETRDGDGGLDGYDCISYNGNAKNILSIGAVSDIPGGYSQPSDVVAAAFSSWGPTDDGRIKPDFVANGVTLYSTNSTGDADYRSLSGTSMSTPNCAGSLNLLVRYYESSHGGAPRSSTMKAVLMQTADEAGVAEGPDYSFGWGLVDTREAAALILADSLTQGMIVEDSLADGETDQFAFQTANTGPIRISIAWTDPAGSTPAPAVNPPDLMLVNDLDLRVERIGGSTHEPYVLDPAAPATAPTRGDNFRDNAEQVYVASAAPGTYRVTVAHKGTLAAPQFYSIVCSRPLGPVVVPSEPVVAASDTSCARVLVEWGSVAAADSYEVTRDAEILATVPASTLVYSDTVSAGIYTYGVSALNVFGRSLPGTDEGTALGAPVAPGTVAAGDTSHVYVRVDWTASATADFYRVFRDDSLLVTLPATVLTYADTVAAGTYLYGVSAGNQCGFTAPATDSGSVLANPAAAPSGASPRSYALFPAAPNPFHPSTRIAFEVPEPVRVVLSIYDAGGRLVSSLADHDHPAGRFIAVWDGTDDAGRDVPSGIYLARIRAGRFEARTRLVLLR